jgi:hypothetical protein
MPAPVSVVPPPSVLAVVVIYMTGIGDPKRTSASKIHDSSTAAKPADDRPRMVIERVHFLPRHTHDDARLPYAARPIDYVGRQVQGTPLAHRFPTCPPTDPVSSIVLNDLWPGHLGAASGDAAQRDKTSRKLCGLKDDRFTATPQPRPGDLNVMSSSIHNAEKNIFLTLRVRKIVIGGEVAPSSPSHVTLSGRRYCRGQERQCSRTVSSRPNRMRTYSRT